MISSRPFYCNSWWMAHDCVHHTQIWHVELNKDMTPSPPFQDALGRKNTNGVVFLLFIFPSIFPAVSGFLLFSPSCRSSRPGKVSKTWPPLRSSWKPMGFKRCPACQYPCEKADPLSCDHITCDLWMQKIAWSGAAMDLTQKMASSKSTHTYLRRAPQEWHLPQVYVNYCKLY